MHITYWYRFWGKAPTGWIRTGTSVCRRIRLSVLRVSSCRDRARAAWDLHIGAIGQKRFCFACYRLIRPGQIYHLTIEFEVLCEDCALSEGVIRVRGDLAVEVRRDRLLIKRG